MDRSKGIGNINYYKAYIKQIHMPIVLHLFTAQIIQLRKTTFPR